MSRTDHFSTTDLYDRYLDQARVPTIVLAHFGGRTKFMGSAVTVKCFEDNSRVKELVGSPGDGRVMVVDGGASLRCALVGDMLAVQARSSGWEGIIVHGCVRDREALAGIDLGVMAIAATPRKSTRHGEGQVDIPIRLGDVWCHPGDRVFADQDGILLLGAASTGGGSRD